MHYALPILIIALTIPVFFALGRGGFAPFGRLQAGLRIFVATIMVLAGCGHFLWPHLVASAIPPAFPNRYALAIISGACAVAGGVGLLFSRVRRLAAVCLAVFMIAIFPSNVYIAGQTVGPITFPGVPVRGAMQIVFIAVILLGGWGAPIFSKKKPA
jgi:uncharacterized membrane protein